jgi:hypothetical protein
VSDDRAKDAEQATDAGSGGLMKKLFTKKTDTEDTRQAPPPSEGVAHIPSTVLTVEYLDESEGMDAALREMQERLRRVEEIVGNMQETQGQLIAAVNQQAKDIGRFVESIGRRIDKLYRRVTGGEITSTGRKETEFPGESAVAFPVDVDASAMGLPQDVAEDRDHQNAWRIARVLAADLEAYHEDAVKEGVLYGTFYKLLRDPIEKARATYEQRATPDIVRNYDYFSKALDELIVRKRMELEQEGAV